MELLFLQILAFSSFFFTTPIQRNSIDSLDKIYQNETEIQQKILVLREISESFDKDLNIDSSTFKYHSELIELARSTNDSLAVAEGWIRVGLYQYFNAEIGLSTKSYFNALNSLKNNDQVLCGYSGAC